MIRVIVVFVLVDFAWLFFRVPDMTTAMQMIKTVVTDLQISTLLSEWWFDYGMSKIEYLMWIAVAFGVFCMEVWEEKNVEFWTILEKQSWWIRWMVYIMVIFLLVMTWFIGMGSDAKSFLYQNF